MIKVYVLMIIFLLSGCVERNVSLEKNLVELRKLNIVDGGTNGLENSELNASTETAEAIISLLLAAGKGNSDAQNSLGQMYSNGQGVVKDYNEAIKWFRLAVEQGNADAQKNLGIMYSNGLGVEKDYKEAIEWFRLAGDQGNADAQFTLGVMYANGQGVVKDDREAVKWYRLAAGQGIANAQNNLGVMFGNGQGVEKNASEALKWYRLAADQGDANAKNNIAGLLAAQQPEQDTQIIEVQNKTDKCNATVKNLSLQSGDILQGLTPGKSIGQITILKKNKTTKKIKVCLFSDICYRSEIISVDNCHISKTPYYIGDKENWYRTEEAQEQEQKYAQEHAQEHAQTEQSKVINSLIQGISNLQK